MTSLRVTWHDYGILGHSFPKLTLALLLSPSMPRSSTLMQKRKKALEGLECPERWPRPINGNGHFRERCDVTKRHLARLCNFETLRPNINPCPMDTLRTSTLMRKRKKAIDCLECPERWPRPINGSGHFRERCDVTKRHLARLCNFGKLTLALWSNPNHAAHFHTHVGTQKSNRMS